VIVFVFGGSSIALLEFINIVLILTIIEESVYVVISVHGVANLDLKVNVVLKN
jgi:hypothetical protein